MEKLFEFIKIFHMLNCIILICKKIYDWNKWRVFNTLNEYGYNHRLIQHAQEAFLNVSYNFRSLGYKNIFRLLWNRSMTQNKKIFFNLLNSKRMSIKFRTFFSVFRGTIWCSERGMSFPVQTLNSSQLLINKQWNYSLM